MLRNFLTTVAGGPPRRAAAPPPHFSVQTNGVSFLTASGAGGRFPFPPIASGNVTTIGAWVLLHSLAALQVIWQVGPDVGADKLVGSLDFADFNGHFRAVASNGVVFTTLNSFLTPLVDTWYYIGVGFDSSAIGMTIWDTTHQIESISVGLVQPGYNTIVNPDLGVMAAPNGVRNMVSGGRVDSLGIWPNTAIPSLGPVWNNGQAIEYNALPAAFLPPKLQLWANFNEASGSATYLDSTGGGDLVAHGGGLTRQVGAGF